MPARLQLKLAVLAPLTVTVTMPVGVIAVPSEVSVTVIVRVTMPPTVTDVGPLTLVVVARRLTIRVSLPHALLAWLLFVSPL